MNKSIPKIVSGLLIILIAWALVTQNTVKEPTSIPINNTKTTIAFIEMWSNYTSMAKLFEEIIEPEINQYATDVNSSIVFDFLVVHADKSKEALDSIIGLDSMGVRYIIGSNCVACVAYSYINENDMVLVSSRSMQPLFSMEDEHMFRVCPSDKHQGQVISQMLRSKGKEKIAVLRRGDSWADGVFETLDESWGAESIIVDIRYPAESSNFTGTLEKLSNSLNESVTDGVPVEKIGVVALSYNEMRVIGNQSRVYPLLSEVEWFGSTGTAMLDINSGESVTNISLVGLDELGVYSPVHSVAYNDKWDRLASRYLELTGEYPDSVIGYDYDAAWLIALTLMEVASEDRSVFADTIPRIGSSYTGVTGLLELDEFGDRNNPPYDIWGYNLVNNEVTKVKVGYYFGKTQEIEWFDP